MSTKNMLIDLRNISTYFHDEIKNQERARMIVNAVNSKKGDITVLVAEKLPCGKYVLTENFTYCSALLAMNGSKSVPVLVYPNTSEKERLLHILKTTIPLEKGISWLFKNEHVMKLIENHGMSVVEIAKKIDFNREVIERYVLDKRIPNHIREVALKAEAKTVLERICSCKVIPEEMKTILYEKAVFMKGDDRRLTGKKYDLMKMFCSANEIPRSLLLNRKKLDDLINKLILTNFNLHDHMQILLKSYIDSHTTILDGDMGYISTVKIDSEITYYT